MSEPTSAEPDPYAHRRARGDQLVVPSRVARVAVVLFAAGAIGLLGLVIGAAVAPKPVEDLPAPHTIPHVAGGTSLRVAMIHDVLHERYSTHGEAWYRERERRTREALAREDEAAPTDRLLDLLDDLSAALDRQHRSDEAVEVQRKKLALVERLHGPRPQGIVLPPAQPITYEDVASLALLDPQRRQRTRARFDAMNTRTLSAAERAWYRTCANLGTHLVHASFGRAREGDAEAKARLAEGLQHVRWSIDLNPGAHFGREVWQAVAIGFILRAIDDPSLLTRYDMIGQPLDRGSDEGRLEELALEDQRVQRWWTQYRSQRATLDAWAAGTLDEAGRRGALEKVWTFRARLVHVGGAPGFVAATGADLEGPSPFDEPALGLLGMWTLGGGPNPHSAMALGGLCERIGQRRVAWTAYARALGLADRFWPDPKVREALVEHCKRRQVMIEESLMISGVDRPEAMQVRHEAELAFGVRYQEARHRHEAERIAAGADIDAPDFFDDFERTFEAEHGPIASPVGEADRARVRARSPTGLDIVSLGLAAAAVGAWLGLAVRRRA